jgi:undecaprenyl-diphosphatase
MKIWQGIVLGLIQGITEFLPVSSSGHLLFFEKLGVGEESIFFNICMHMGTLFSVIIVTRKTLVQIVKNRQDKTLRFLILSCLPTVAIALLFKALAPTLLSGAYLPFGFMATTVCLIACEKLDFAQNKGLSVKSSILSGVFQGIAVLPGISRSGATITALRLSGVDKKQSADFSFLMSIPIILGSLILESIDLFKGEFTLPTRDILPLILGTLTAFISGCFAIKFFLKMVKDKSLLPFAIYTFILSVASFFLMAK